MAQLRVVSFGQRLAGHDVACEELMAFFDEATEEGRGTRVAVRVIDEQRRVEEVPHGASVGFLGAQGVDPGADLVA